jgi:hypothetical protein
MMINRSAIGAKGAPFDLWVERGKVMEFARAVRAEHPDHSTGLAPIAPPTFLTTQNTAPVSCSCSSCFRSRVLYTRQEHAPAPA